MVSYLKKRKRSMNKIRSL